MYQKSKYLLIFAVFFGLVSCAKVSEQNQLKQRINDLVHVIESHNEDEIPGYLANDFSAGKETSKEKFNLFIHYHMQRHQKISVVKANEKITVHGSTADVTAEVLLFGINEWLPEQSQKFYVESRWVKEKDNWFIERLRWDVDSDQG
jgi:hypothetical protein